MGEAFSLDSEAEIIINRLKEDGKYKLNLLFHCFNGDRVDIVAKTGKENPKEIEIFCSTEVELSDPALTSLQFADPEEGAMEYSKKALVVYDGNKMEMGQLGSQDYIFKSGVKPKDAVVKIYLLDYEKK